MIIFSYIIYFSKPVVWISSKLPRQINNHPQPQKLDLPPPPNTLVSKARVKQFPDDF